MKEESILAAILGICTLAFILSAGFQNSIGIIAIILIFVVPNENEYGYQRSQRNRYEVQ